MGYRLDQRLLGRREHLQPRRPERSFGDRSCRRWLPDAPGFSLVARRPVVRAGRAWICHLDIAPESKWVQDHDQSGFGVTCVEYTHEQLQALDWADLKALLRIGRLIPVP